jgi:hypothetical protein
MSASGSKKSSTRPTDMNETEKQANHQTLLVIWGALLGSQIIFIVLAYVITGNELFPPDLSKPLLGRNIWVVAAAAVFAVGALSYSFYSRTITLQRSVGQQSIALVTQAMITGIALAESVSLCGLFLAIAYRYQYFFIWMIVGIIATVLQFPRRSDIDNATFRTSQ